MTWLGWVLHWLAVHTGVENEASHYYAFWSGFGSDLSEIAIPAAAWGLFRKHNCHQRRCWRIGRHVVDGTPWCDRHHQKARSAAVRAA